MIGSRILLAASIAALVVVLGGGAPRPEVDRAAEEAVATATYRALEAIDRLQAQLAPAIDLLRTGSARVVAGDEDPVEPLAAAAGRILAAAPGLIDVRRAFADVERARIARDPGAQPLPEPPQPGELESVASQLTDAAEDGATFAETRRRAETVSSGLVDALESVAAGEPEAANERLLIGLVAIDELRAWEDDAPVLSVWIETVDAMIRAMQRLVDAVLASDAEEATAAQAEFEAAAENAPEADRALRIGLAEAGSALTEVSRGRLAGVLAALDELELALRAARTEVDA
jgi:hypothetical protein